MFSQSVYLISKWFCELKIRLDDISCEQKLFFLKFETKWCIKLRHLFSDLISLPVINKLIINQHCLGRFSIIFAINFSQLKINQRFWCFNCSSKIYRYESQVQNKFRKVKNSLSSSDNNRCAIVSDMSNVSISQPENNKRIVILRRCSKASCTFTISFFRTNIFIQGFWYFNLNKSNFKAQSDTLDIRLLLCMVSHNLTSQ